MESKKENDQLKFSSFQQFWPFYVSQHRNRINQILHFVGTLTGLTAGVFLALQHQWLNALIVMLIVGYGLAWIGHFVFEKNRPATFRYPLYSFLADLRMVICLVLKRRF